MDHYNEVTHLLLNTETDSPYLKSILKYTYFYETLKINQNNPYVKINAIDILIITSKITTIEHYTSKILHLILKIHSKINCFFYIIVRLRR